MELSARYSKCMKIESEAREGNCKSLVAKYTSMEIQQEVRWQSLRVVLGNIEALSTSEMIWRTCDGVVYRSI